MFTAVNQEISSTKHKVFVKIALHLTPMSGQKLNIQDKIAKNEKTK